jgi:hypothetical protein
VSTRNKKKLTRKPKANAVKSKRRPHRPATVRRSAPPHERFAEAPPTTEPTSAEPAEPTTESTAEVTVEPETESTTEPETEATTEPETEATTEPETEATTESTTEPAPRWAAEDPTAVWWDDVWPFRDETSEGSSLAEATDPIEATEEPYLTPYVEPGEDPALAVPPLSVPPAGRSQGGLALLSVLAAAAVVVAVLVWWSHSRGTTEQTVAIHGHPYAAPVHLVRGSSFVRSRVLPSGDILVKHWIRTDRPVESMKLQVPRVPGLPRHALSVSGLVLASNGTLTTASSPVNPVGVTTFALPPTHQLYVSYLLSGVVQSSGGAGERALARITALDVTTASPVERTTLAVVGAKVLALACTPQGKDMPTPCGNDSGGTWSAHLGQAEQGSQVMAQINLS